MQTIDQLNKTLLTNEHQKLWLILSHDILADPDGQVKKSLDSTYHLNWEKQFISQDIINNISILGYPIITDAAYKILIYYYSK